MPLKLFKGSNGSPNFRIRGTHFGVRIDQSAGTSDYKLASRQLKQTKNDIERGAIRPKVIGSTFAEAVELYVKETKNQRFILPLFDYFRDKPLLEITQQDIMRASHDLYPNASNATRNRQVFTPVLAIMRLSGVVIACNRPENSKGNRRTFFLTHENAAKLINAAYDIDAEFGLFLTFLLYTGARLNDVISLTVDNLNLSEARAFIPKTKNGKSRNIYLPPELVAAMAGHPDGYDREGKVFRFVKGRTITKKLRAAEAASGVPIPTGLAFHAFRHTWGAWMRRYGGLDTSGLIATGAWSSRDAAMVYEHVDTTDAAKRADLLPSIKIGSF